VLIDGDLPESAPKIVASIKALGFRIKDVKLILNSHVHYDHAGGIAELHRLSGATDLWKRIERRDQGGDANALVDSTACRRLADTSRANLEKRVAGEQAGEH
jgi:glyoxylase-like metal-dependent hydrolase (beta-lactamase superfamily II)